MIHYTTIHRNWRSKMFLAAVCAAAAGSASLVRADLIRLNTGEVLQGKVVATTAEVVTFSHPVLGELKIPAANVQATALGDAPLPPLPVDPNSPAVAQPAPVVAPQPAPAPAPEPTEPAGEEIKPAPYQLFPGWDSSFEFGFSGSTGNSEQTNVYAAFKTLNETASDRWKIDASYLFAKQDGERTENEFTTGVLKDWLLPDSPWFYFAQGRYDYDEFESWDQRVALNGGIGLDWIKQENLRVTFRVGGGAKREFGSDNDEWTPEGLAGAEVEWKITDRQTFNAATTYYPDLSDTSEFRIISSADWTLKIDKMDGVSIKLGVKHEYESEVDPGNDRNDLKYFGALVFDF